MSMFEKVNNLLQISEEIINNIPIISLIGNKELSIENYKGIVLYSEDKIKINTTLGIVSVIGVELSLSKVITEKIIITGKIIEVNYSN